MQQAEWKAQQFLPGGGPQLPNGAQWADEGVQRFTQGLPIGGPGLAQEGLSQLQSSGMGPVVYLVAGLVAALTVVIGLITGAGGPVLDRLVPSDTEQIAYQVDLIEPAELLPLSVTGALSDGTLDTALKLAWPRSQAARSCAEPGQPGFRLRFAAETSPSTMVVHSSFDPPDDAETPALWPGPAILIVRGENGCGQFDLSEPFGESSLDVGSLIGGGGTWLEVSVAERWPAEIVVNEAVAIGELTLVE